MKDLQTLWDQFKKAHSRCEIDGSGRNSNPAQNGASTRALKRFFAELKAQRKCDDMEAINIMNREFNTSI